MALTVGLILVLALTFIRCWPELVLMARHHEPSLTQRASP